MTHPCLPLIRRLMPNAAWRTWLRLHPSWHAPVLAAVACAGVAGASLPSGPVRTPLPWIGAPGWVQHSDMQPGYGLAGYGVPHLPGLTFSGLAGAAGASPVGSSPMLAEGSAGPAVGGYPTPAYAPRLLPSYARPDAVAVPEPHGLAVLAVAMAAVGLMRRWV